MNIGVSGMETGKLKIDNDPPSDLVWSSTFGRALLQEQPLEALLQLVARETVRCLRVETAAVALLDRKREALHIPVAAGRRKEQWQDLVLPLDTSPFSRAFRTGGAVHFTPSTRQTTASSEEIMQILKIRAAAIAPLQIRHEVAGIIAAINPTDQRTTFGSEDLRLLDQLAEQAALAVETVRLRTERERQIIQTKALLRATQTLTSTRTLPEILDRIIEIGVITLGAQRLALLHHEVAEGCPTLVASHGLTEAHRQALQNGEGDAAFFHQIAHTPPTRPTLLRGEPIFIRDIRTDHATRGALASIAAKEGFRAVAFVPLSVHHRLTGVLTLYKPLPHEFTPAEIEMLRILADAAAIALETADLHHQRETMLHQLLEANRAKGEFLDRVTEDLMDPLEQTLSVAETLQSPSAGPLTPTQAGSLSQIRREISRHRDLLERALLVSRLASGRMEPRYEPVSPAPLLQGIAQEFTAMVSSRTVTLQCRTEGLPPALYTDRAHLQLMVAKLVSETVRLAGEGDLVLLQAGVTTDPPQRLRVSVSLKASPSASASPSGRKERTRRSGHSRDERTVPSGGPGIHGSEEKVAAATQESLDLFLTRRLAWLHGGEIRVESLPHPGVAYTLLLPLLREKDLLVHQIDLALRRAQDRQRPLSLILVKERHLGESSLRPAQSAAQEKARGWMKRAASVCHTVVRGPQDLVLPPTRGRIGILAQTDRQGALSIARRLSQAFRRHQLSASMGIATYPAEAAEAEELIARADAAPGPRDEREGHARPKG